MMSFTFSFAFTMNKYLEPWLMLLIYRGLWSVEDVSIDIIIKLVLP